MACEKREDIREEMKRIYEEIPASRCKEGCFRCCTNMIQATPGEEAAMGGYTYSGVCSHLKNGRCLVYRNRPFVCRIYGTSDILKCDGCLPERFLTEKETMDLVHAYTLLRKEEEKTMSEIKAVMPENNMTGDSLFYTLANDALSKECKRLCDFADELAKDPVRKKERIAEYKCAKIRYGVVSLIHSTLYNTNRYRKTHSCEETHYLPVPFDDMLKAKNEYMAQYEAAPDSEKAETSLYYAVLTFTDRTLALYEGKLPHADDWEKIELEERIGGLRFAKECLNEAWEKRKGENV